MTTCLEDKISLARLIGHVNGPSKGVIDFLNSITWIALRATDDILSHMLIGEHGHVSDTQRLENIFLEVVAKLQAAYALNTSARPVNVNL